MIVVRTHGGLGNQLFQMVYSTLCAKQQACNSVFYIHEANYPHRMPFELPEIGEPLTTPIIRALSATRLPKVLYKLGISRAERVTIVNNMFLDGYFQSIDQYRDFSSQDIADTIQMFRSAVGIRSKPKHNRLVHIRLGDFFGSEAEQRKHLESRISSLVANDTIISNRDDLFYENATISKILDAKNITYRNTSDLSGRRVLSLMSDYATINSNNSTLAFWATVLGGRKLEISDSRLQKLYEYFYRVSWKCT